MSSSCRPRRRAHWQRRGVYNQTKRSHASSSSGRRSRSSRLGGVLSIWRDCYTALQSEQGANSTLSLVASSLFVMQMDQGRLFHRPGSLILKIAAPRRPVSEQGGDAGDRGLLLRGRLRFRTVDCEIRHPRFESGRGLLPDTIENGICKTKQAPGRVLCSCAFRVVTTLRRRACVNGERGRASE